MNKTEYSVIKNEWIKSQIKGASDKIQNGLNMPYYLGIIASLKALEEQLIPLFEQNEEAIAQINYELNEEQYRHSTNDAL